MAKFELNTYGENDEILKTFATDHVKWGVFVNALALNDKIEGAGAAEQFAAVNGLVKSIFSGMNDEDLMNADIEDVFNTFQQIVRLAKNLNGSKNG